MQEIAEFFEDFSEQVKEVIRLHLVRHEDLSEMLEQLGLQAEADLQDQAKAVRAFISNYGPIYFLTAIKTDLSSRRIQSMTSLVQGSNRETDRPAPAPGKAVPTPGNPTPPRMLPSEKPRPIIPRAQRTPSMAPSHAIPLRSPHRAAKMPMIEVPGYSGPERRSGVDRRSSKTKRRVSVELIYKNKRFGRGERRKIVRREADRKKDSE